MQKVKDTLRATVNLSYDGRVFKIYHGPDAEKRFANEVRILRHLEARGCDFVPRLLEADAKQLRIITTNCGSRVEHLDRTGHEGIVCGTGKIWRPARRPGHAQRDLPLSDGRFCLIDFELATILPRLPTTTSK